MSVGTGWTYGPAACASVVDGLLAPLVRGRDAVDVTGTWQAMVRAVRNAGRPGVAGMALSAVDCALWDLKARLLGLPLHRLLGAVHERCRCTAVAVSPATTTSAGRTARALGRRAATSPA